MGSTDILSRYLFWKKELLMDVFKYGFESSLTSTLYVSVASLRPILYMIYENSNMITYSEHKKLVFYSIIRLLVFPLIDILQTCSRINRVYSWNRQLLAYLIPFDLTSWEDDLFSTVLNRKMEEVKIKDKETYDKIQDLKIKIDKTISRTRIGTVMVPPVVIDYIKLYWIVLERVVLLIYLICVVRRFKKLPKPKSLPYRQTEYLPSQLKHLFPRSVVLSMKIYYKNILGTLLGSLCLQTIALFAIQALAMYEPHQSLILLNPLLFDSISLAFWLGEVLSMILAVSILIPSKVLKVMKRLRQIDTFFEETYKIRFLRMDFLFWDPFISEQESCDSIGHLSYILDSEDYPLPDWTKRKLSKEAKLGINSIANETDDVFLKIQMDNKNHGLCGDVIDIEVKNSTRTDEDNLLDNDYQIKPEVHGNNISIDIKKLNIQ